MAIFCYLCQIMKKCFLEVSCLIWTMCLPFYSLLHEPFKSIPVIWTVHECSLAHRISEHNSSGIFQIIDAWKEAFGRANVIVFPNYILPVLSFFS
jgi:hypothetical protein